MMRDVLFDQSKTALDARENMGGVDVGSGVLDDDRNAENGEAVDFIYALAAIVPKSL